MVPRSCRYTCLVKSVTERMFSICLIQNGYTLIDSGRSFFRSILRPLVPGPTEENHVLPCAHNDVLLPADTLIHGNWIAWEISEALDPGEDDITSRASHGHGLLQAKTLARGEIRLPPSAICCHLSSTIHSECTTGEDTGLVQASCL